MLILWSWQKRFLRLHIHNTGIHTVYVWYSIIYVYNACTYTPTVFMVWPKVVTRSSSWQLLNFTLQGNGSVHLLLSLVALLLEKGFLVLTEKGSGWALELANMWWYKHRNLAPRRESNSDPPVVKPVAFSRYWLNYCRHFLYSTQLGWSWPV